MEIVIEKIDNNSPFLGQVINLGDSNNETLGFFPHDAFIEAARKGNIIIAINNGSCVGYLLYRIVKTKHRVSITHLCINENYRKSGIGRRLINHLINTTKEWRGISLYCRRDYESNQFWSHIGFKYYGEKVGRGKDKVPLTHYWFDHNQPSLLKVASETIIHLKSYQAIIDMNIFIELFKNANHPLRADWLLEDLAICVTPEIRNEINRDNDRNKRLQKLEYASSFPELSVDNIKFKQIYEILKQYYLLPIQTRDSSDLEHLSYAIASKADFFVTNDKNLINKLKNAVFIEFGLLIVSEDDLIVYFDELINQASYQVNRLAGSLIHISRVTSGEGDHLADIFHRQMSDKKGAFRDVLGNFLSSPNKFETYVVTTQEQAPIALLVLSVKKDQTTMEIPLIRVIKGPLSPSLESQIVFWLVTQAVSNSLFLVRILESELSSELIEALHENSFIKSDGIWEKANLIGLQDKNKIEENLIQGQLRSSGNNRIFDSIRKEFNDTFISSNPSQLISLEKLLWPLKIDSSDIPTYIVPIQAIWAMNLFDFKLGSQTLLGSDPSLVLRMENVYYRSAKTNLPKCPSRILWYVSRDKKRQFQGVMSIRACSYGEQVFVGSPKVLFKQNKKLGVYDWDNVLKTANNNPDNEILLFRFTRTEIFDSPIPLVEFKHLSGRKSAPQAPQIIDSGLFGNLYNYGTKQRGN
ncbi:MAG: GNAT family N-acetyltransferase [Anaerolineaceae bacterium]